ncbi:DUF5984 family protein [Nocardia sp. CA-129566]|uniref:DUF5984 family protein n=1 Tax=Nocardia sp. CA-129566 TaxID=3239976 RepID=UPI003D958FFA
MIRFRFGLTPLDEVTPWGERNSLRWWREADTIVIAWRYAADPHSEISFTAPECGRASVPTEEFVSAVTDFDRSLLDAMQTRVR